MKNYYILTYGFAIFAMFFGSGNLVFPIEVGYSGSANWLFGFFGLFLTGILLPFLGLFVIKLHKGSYINFFAQGGKLAKFILPLFTLSLLGSFAVVPRCIVVAYGGVNFISSELSLFVFSLCFSLVTYFACLKEKLMVGLLGRFMSPVMVLLLIVLIAFGISDENSQLQEMPLMDSFANGFTTGYQTMDLFAAFFFSSLVYRQLQTSMPKGVSDKELLKYSIKPAILGSILLGLVYFGLVFLGAHYRDKLDLNNPELMLPAISNYLLGRYSAIFIAIAMLFSCFTTAVALNNIYADYLCDLFKLEKKHFSKMLILTTLISFIISLLNFKGIAAFLVPVLEVSYPGLIALTLLSLFSTQASRMKLIIFWAITIFMVVLKLC